MFTLWNSHTLKHKHLEMHHLQEGCIILAQPCPSKEETKSIIAQTASAMLQLQRERTGPRAHI